MLEKVEVNYKEVKVKSINKIVITPKIEKILEDLNSKKVKNFKGELIDNVDYYKSRELLNKEVDDILTFEDIKVVSRDIDTFSKLVLLKPNSSIPARVCPGIALTIGVTLLLDFVNRALTPQA